MELDLRLTLGNLEQRLRSFTAHLEWRIVVYGVDRPASGSDAPRLRRIEVLGDMDDEMADLVANAAWLTRTTIVGDVARIAAALREPSEVQKYRPFGVHHVAAGVSSSNARGSVIASPCFDPWQTSVSERVQRRVLGAIAVAGNLPAQAVVANTDLRYLIEQYAKTVASFLETAPFEKDQRLVEWMLPDIEVVPAEHVPPKSLVSGFQASTSSPTVPKYSHVEVFPTEAVRITGYSDDFEPYTARGEKWLQFGPGLAVSKTGLEAFARGWTQRKADNEYIQQLDTAGSSGDW